jgi:hypothetical protein
MRRSGVVLPEDPSDEELVSRNWTLSESDRREVLLYRGSGSGCSPQD